MLHISHGLVRLLQCWVWWWYRMLITGVQATFYMGDSWTVCCQLLISLLCWGHWVCTQLRDSYAWSWALYVIIPMFWEERVGHWFIWTCMSEVRKVAKYVIKLSLWVSCSLCTTSCLLPVGQFNYLKQNSAMSELNSLQHKTCFLSQDNITPLELL